jgi:hypothetical protein
MYTKDLCVWCRHLPSSCRHLLDGVENTYSLRHTKIDGARGTTKSKLRRVRGLMKSNPRTFKHISDSRSFAVGYGPDQFARFMKLPSLLEKQFRVPRAVARKHGEKGHKALLEENENMHARPEVREILIAGKLRRWALIGQHPHAYPNCSPAKARRNFSRLFSRYPQIAQRLGMTPISAYPAV